ncbi:MAG TPA: hypothetical protein VGE47_17080, partial [Burkholderiaceae bacterium]
MPLRDAPAARAIALLSDPDGQLSASDIAQAPPLADHSLVFHSLQGGFARAGGRPAPSRTHPPPRRAAENPMPKFDITKLNVAVDRLLEQTDNPRHRFLLMAYGRHRYLEVAGRYQEIFAPDMTVGRPVYHLNVNGNELLLRGEERVKSLYRMWAETHQSIFYVEDEQVAVCDNHILSVAGT